jgi:predicted permease
MYAVLDAVLHPYVPFRGAERLYWAGLIGDGASGRVTWFDKFARIRDDAHLHSDIAVNSFVTHELVHSSSGAGTATVVGVSANFFSLLGIEPAAGRVFREDIPYAANVNAVVISFGMWRRLFAAGDIADAAVTIGERTYDVIGVTPAGMPGDVWTLLPPSVMTAGTGVQHASVVLRLRPGITLDVAQAQLATVAERLTAQFGTGRRQFWFPLYSLIPDPIRFQDFHAAMAGAALAVLLIACANLANLMFARGLSRRRDLAVQMALGASRRTVVEQVLAECALVALGGGALGMVLSLWGVDVLLHRMPPDVRFIGTLVPHVSWRVFAFGAAATVATIGLVGALPAIRTSNVDVAGPLKHTAGTTTMRTRSRYSALVMVQMAAATVLLMAAGVLVKAAERIGAYEFGYDTQGLLTAFISVSRDTQVNFHDLLRRVQNVDGVGAAALMTRRAPEGFTVTSDLATGVGDNQVFQRRYAAVSANFLRTLGIPVLAGRDFSDGDGAAGGAVIVSREAARRLWPGLDEPVGRRVKLGRPGSPGPWLPVVGVTRNVAMDFERDPDLEPEPPIYVVTRDVAGRFPWIVARAKQDEARVALLLRRIIRDAAPGAAVAVYPWSRGFDDIVNARRFVAGLFTLFAFFALALAAVGLYGVLLYAVSRRMREFGVRIALGARSRDLLKMVVHDGFVMVLAGTGVGAFLAMWGARLLGRWLYNVNPTDVVALVAAETVLFAVALVACLVPGLKAMRADPVEVLRAT